MELVPTRATISNHSLGFRYLSESIKPIQTPSSLSESVSRIVRILYMQENPVTLIAPFDSLQKNDWCLIEWQIKKIFRNRDYWNSRHKYIRYKRIKIPTGSRLCCKSTLCDGNPQARSYFKYEILATQSTPSCEVSCKYQSHSSNFFFLKKRKSKKQKQTKQYQIYLSGLIPELNLSIYPFSHLIINLNFKIVHTRTELAFIRLYFSFFSFSFFFLAFMTWVFGFFVFFDLINVHFILLLNYGCAE